MIVAAIKARRPHRLPHRTMAAGEVLCLMQFSSEDDCRFFANHLRWSAFGVERVTDPTIQPGPSAAPAPAPAPASAEPASESPGPAPTRRNRPQDRR